MWHSRSSGVTGFETWLHCPKNAPGHSHTMSAILLRNREIDSFTQITGQDFLITTENTTLTENTVFLVKIHVYWNSELYSSVVHPLFTPRTLNQKVIIRMKLPLWSLGNSLTWCFMIFLNYSTLGNAVGEQFLSLSQRKKFMVEHTLTFRKKKKIWAECILHPHLHALPHRWDCKWHPAFRKQSAQF